MSPQRTSTTMELLPLVCLCLLSCSGDAVRVEVIEGSDAVLPCLISTEDLEGNKFDWKKDGQKEVFMYDAGIHYNNGRPGQDEQFRGRVSHFQDQLQNGDASIKITRTMVADSGNYSCDFPRLQPRQTSIIELVVDPRVEVFVKEDSDAVLPCSPDPKVDLTGQVFDWKKDDQKEKKEVFLHGSDGHTTQGPDFTERVSHFQDQLKNGSASIKIHRVKKTDRGIYSCHFPHLQSQTFFMKLVVGAFKPYVTIVRTDDERMLQCEVLGASPKPKVEWKDSSGNILPVKDLKETKRGDSYDIVLQTALTKTDTFACVVTQEEFSHQIYAEIDAAVIVPPPKSAVRVIVEESSDAVLPCLISTEDLEGKLFDWKKDGQKDVFMYDAGIHYNNGRPGQDEQFKGRVSHFQDQLQNGDASIKITRTKMADSGIYSCDFPRLQPRQTSIIELVVARIRVVVEQDSDAVLPCLISPEEDLTQKVFDWKKDGQKEVFLYSAGKNDANRGQDQQFTDRVSHFQDQLQNGNASIMINKTKMADRGNYSCIFPDLQSQTSIIELVVERVLKDRRGEEPGASKPSVTTLMTGGVRMLQCEVLGASPKPKVEWRDGSGNILPVKDLKETKRGDIYDIVLRAAFTKPDTFRCVVTQEEISHQSYADIDLNINGSNTVVVLSLLLVVVSIVAVVAIVLYLKNRNKQHCKKGEKKIDGEKTDSEAKPLNPPEKNPGSTPNAANGQPDTEENTAV